MSTSGAVSAGRVVNTDRYPLSEPGGPGWRAVVDSTRAELAEIGCSVLPEFVRPQLLTALREECARIAPLAHSEVERVNAYNIAVDTPLPDGHPARRVMERGN